MPVSGTSTFKSFAGNASTSTYYPLLPDIEYAATTEIEGTADGIALVNGVDFTVHLTSGVQTTVAYSSGITLVFSRVTPLTQPSNFPSGETPQGAAVETGLDRIVRQVQEASAGSDRSLKSPVGVAGAELVAGEFSRLNAAGTAVESLTPLEIATEADAVLDAQAAAAAASAASAALSAAAAAALSATSVSTSRLAERRQLPGEVSDGVYTGLDSFTKDAFGEVETALVAGQLLTKENVKRIGSDASEYINWQSPTRITDSDGVDDSYNAWPWSMGFYDPFRNKVVIPYTTKKNHNESSDTIDYYNGITKVRFIEDASNVDVTSVTITAATEVLNGAAGTSWLAQAAGIDLHTGDYYIIPTRTVHPADQGDDDVAQVMRSVDGGAVWTNLGFLKNEAGTNLNGSYVMGLTQLTSGRWVFAFPTNTNIPTDSDYDVYISDTLPYCRKIATIPKALPGDPGGSSPNWMLWELQWVETLPGEGFIFARTTMDSGVGVTGGVIASSRFYDDMETVGNFTLTNVAAASNPCSVIYDNSTRTLHMMSGARGNTTVGGIWYSEATLAEAAAGKWRNTTREGTFVNDMLAKPSDSGYPSLVKAVTRYFCVYYDRKTAGVSEVTDIYLLAGTLAKRTPTLVTSATGFRTPTTMIKGNLIGGGCLAFYESHGGFNWQDEEPTQILGLQTKHNNSRTLKALTSSTNSVKPTWAGAGVWNFTKATKAMLLADERTFDWTPMDEGIGFTANLYISSVTNDIENIVSLIARGSGIDGINILQLTHRSTSSILKTLAITDKDDAADAYNIVVTSHLNTWKNFSCWIDLATSELRLYINGVLQDVGVGEAAPTTLTSSVFDHAADLKLVFGWLPASINDGTENLSSDFDWKTGAGIYSTLASLLAASTELQKDL